MNHEQTWNGGIIPIPSTRALAITDSATNAEYLATLIEALDDLERIRLNAVAANAPTIAPR